MRLSTLIGKHVYIPYNTGSLGVGYKEDREGLDAGRMLGGCGLTISCRSDLGLGKKKRQVKNGDKARESCASCMIVFIEICYTWEQSVRKRERARTHTHQLFYMLFSYSQASTLINKEGVKGT